MEATSLTCWQEEAYPPGSSYPPCWYIYCCLINLSYRTRQHWPLGVSTRVKSDEMQMINDILVVDDDTALVDFVIGALREAGYPACAAYDGESALFTIEVARPALIVLDLHLPGLNGVDVVAQLRRHNLAHVPVILMTGDAAAAADLPAAMFPEYLLKPFDLDTLLTSIGRYIRPGHRHIERGVNKPHYPSLEHGRSSYRGAASDERRGHAV